MKETLEKEERGKESYCSVLSGRKEGRTKKDENRNKESRLTDRERTRHDMT